MHQRGDEEEDPGKVPFKVPLQERRGRSEMEIKKKELWGIDNKVHSERKKKGESGPFHCQKRRRKAICSEQKKRRGIGGNDLCHDNERNARR